MDKEQLNRAFDAAVLKASETVKPLPPDVMLSLYAHYKQATQRNNIVPYDKLSENDLRGAFKYHAIIQVRNLTIREAKEEYIRLVGEFIG